MCMVSAVHQYHGQFPNDWWDKTKWDAYQELVRKAAEYDHITGQPDCVDPKKEQLIRDVLDYLQKNGKL